MSGGIVAIIQARMGSSRLPGKVLMRLQDSTVIENIVARLRHAKGVSRVVVATSTESKDDPVAALCSEKNIDCFRGSEHDVLDRLYQAAVEYNASSLIRITGDCPLLDPSLIGKLIELYQRGDFQYAAVFAGAGTAKSNEGRYPSGMDAEIFRFEILREAWREADQPQQREHVTPFIWRQPERFAIGVLKNDRDFGFMRLTLDHKEDYELVKSIYASLYPQNPHFGFEDIVRLYEENPEAFALNVQHIGKEGHEDVWNSTK